jgi:hypothetical protein
MKSGFWDNVCLRTRMYGSVVVHLASASTDGWILFIFGIQGFIHPRLVLIEPERPTSKNRWPSNGSQNKNVDFHENVSDGFH